MIVHPAVIVHGLADARTVLAQGAPVTLLSAPGAALYAGCLWWQALIAASREAYPDAAMTDVLDCADAPGQAMAALRSGVVRLVLAGDVPAWDAVADVARRQGGFVLRQAPPALDIAARDGKYRLRAWLRGGTTAGYHGRLTARLIADG
jgi:hypothetical protein